MSDIELVIKVPEEAYENCIKYDAITASIRKGIQKGVLLPKGHGRIIDENKITKCEQIGLVIKDGNTTRCLATDAPTIIEAERK